MNVAAPRVRSREASSSVIQAAGMRPEPTRDQSAHEVADHVVEERIGGEIEAQSVAATRHRRNRERFHRRARLAEGGAERGKVVRSEEGGHRRCHGRDVERPMIPTDAARQQRRPHRAVGQQVGVVPSGGDEARMEIGSDRLRPLHGDAGRQIPVDPTHPGGGRALHRNVEMHDLRRRVHTGIGTPGSHAGDRRACNGAQRQFQRILNTTTVRLRLPAAKGVARVFEPQSDAHGWRRVQRKNTRESTNAAGGGMSPPPAVIMVAQRLRVFRACPSSAPEGVRSRRKAQP